jgi:hypothetical protein
VDPDFDETKYGFRTLTELMHVGAREGIFKMQRDRQGAWRVTVDATGEADAAEREEEALERAAAASAAGNARGGAEVGAAPRSAAAELEDDFPADESRWEEAPTRATADAADGQGDAEDGVWEEEPLAAGSASETESAESEGAPGSTPRKRTSRRSTAKPGAKSSSRGRRGGAKKKSPKLAET